MLNAHSLTILILAPTVVACTIDPFPARTSQDAATNTGGSGGTGGSDNGGTRSGGTTGAGGTTTAGGTGGTKSSTATITPPATCAPPSILGPSCISPGVYCGNACCSPDYPYYCSQTQKCYQTQDAAAAHCTNMACTACSPCSPCPAGMHVFSMKDPSTGATCRCGCYDDSCLPGQSLTGLCRCSQDTSTSPATCVTSSTVGTCKAGSVSCGPSACCPISNSHYCPLTDLCYASPGEAETACGSTTCYDCVGCGLPCPDGQTLDTSRPGICVCKSN
jgi:hypothetical protein